MHIMCHTRKGNGATVQVTALRISHRNCDLFHLWAAWITIVKCDIYVSQNLFTCLDLLGCVLGGVLWRILCLRGFGHKSTILCSCSIPCGTKLSDELVHGPGRRRRRGHPCRHTRPHRHERQCSDVRRGQDSGCGRGCILFSGTLLTIVGNRAGLSGHCPEK